MTARSRVTAIVAVLSAAVAVAAALALVPAAPAAAHNQVVASVPADGQTLTELPAEFSITTNEPLLDLQGDGGGFAVDLVDATGRHFGDGCSTIVDSTMSTAAVIGDPGDYTIIWQFVSADGHTVSTEFDFTWAPSGDAVADVGSATATRCGEGPGDEPTGDGAVPPQTAEPRDPTAELPLGDVLWIGGAVLAVLVAGGVTLLVVTRRRG